MNRYHSTDELKEKYKPMLIQFINKVEEAYESGDDYEIELDLTDEQINPYQTWQLLNDLGYEDGTIESNGWEMDFWKDFTKEGFQTIVLNGCGITSELKLMIKD